MKDLTLDQTRTADILDLTSRPDPDLFFRRQDPNDQRLGEVVEHDPIAYENADYVIVGYPVDEGVRRNSGRTGASQGPEAIRRALYRLVAPPTLGRQALFDIGDTIPGKTLENTHERHQRVMERLLSDGKRVIALGGGNDMSYPDCAALASTTMNVLAFNIDSHYDVRADSPRNSGTPYRQLLEEKLIQPTRFYQLANKPVANSPDYESYLRDLRVGLYPLDEMRQIGIEPLFKDIFARHSADAIFWGFDMDSIRQQDAPGVSAGYPVGLTAEEAVLIAEIAGADTATRVFEISELNPEFDIDNQTSKLAAMMIAHFFGVR